MWNGRDPILKERLFGLTNSEANHGEDVEEYYFYLDSTPTHSYMKYLYKYPQAAYPYVDLVERNRRRTREEMEYELLDTGVFQEDRYFDIFVEYAKAGPEDILVQITAATHPILGEYCLHCEDDVPLLFTENEINHARLGLNYPNSGPYLKDGINDFLKFAFNKLMLNFTWWVNRKDRFGKNVFEGGFLGLDNIGVFDRSAPLPTGGYLEQADGTAWMALFSQNMLELAVELACHDRTYEDMVHKFAEHFYYIAAAMNKPGQDGMWDEEDGFYYDFLQLPDGSGMRLKVRSMVGLLPLCATTVIEKWQRERVPRALASLMERLRQMPELLESIHPTGLLIVCGNMWSTNTWEAGKAWRLPGENSPGGGSSSSSILFRTTWRRTIHGSSIIPKTSFRGTPTMRETIRRPSFRGPRGDDSGGKTLPCAWCWRSAGEHHLIVVNFSDSSAQGQVRLPWDELRGKSWQMNDLFTGQMYERSGDEMCNPGMYVDLPPWGFHVLARWLPKKSTIKTM